MIGLHGRQYTVVYNHNLKIVILLFLCAYYVIIILCLYYTCTCSLSIATVMRFVADIKEMNEWMYEWKKNSLTIAAYLYSTDNRLTYQYIGRRCRFQAKTKELRQRPRNKYLIGTRKDRAIHRCFMLLSDGNASSIACTVYRHCSKRAVTSSHISDWTYLSSISICCHTHIMLSTYISNVFLPCTVTLQWGETVMGG